KFKRIDSDVLEKLIESVDVPESSLTEENKTQLLEVFQEGFDLKKYTFKFENLSPVEAPVVVTQNEFMRRMKEQSALGGGMNFYGELPDSFQLTLNANHGMMQKVLSDIEGKRSLAKRAVQLALLAKGILVGEDLANFIQSEFEQIEQ
ncbi:MAG: molecular chaperone HtpG, partial [Bacteroidota bacterium]